MNVNRVENRRERSQNRTARAVPLTENARPAANVCLNWLQRDGRRCVTSESAERLSGIELLTANRTRDATRMIPIKIGLPRSHQPDLNTALLQQ